MLYSRIIETAARGEWKMYKDMNEMLHDATRKNNKMIVLFMEQIGNWKPALVISATGCFTTSIWFVPGFNPEYCEM